MKNVLVIGLLLAVSYGAYQIINAPDPSMSQLDGELESLKIEFPSDAHVRPPQWPTSPPPDLARNTPHGNLPEGGAANDPSGMGRTSSLPTTPGRLDDVAKKVPPPAVPPYFGSSGVDAKRADEPLSPSGPLAPIDGPLDSLVTPGANAGDEAVVTVPSTPPTTLPPSMNHAPETTGGAAAGHDNAMPFGLATVDWAELDDLIAESEYRQALMTLTTYYRMELPQDQREQLLMWLDALAGKVIYSTEHWLSNYPYMVQPGDTLQSIADRWSVPPQLVYNVNHSKISDPNALVPGTELKVITGPFRAEISVADRELTLYCNGMYAGRFEVTFGSDAQLEAGVLKVQAKHQEGQNYLDATGSIIPADHPDNPLGPLVVEVTPGLLIHAASPDAMHDERGFVRLSQNDAVDVFGILSPASSISIIR